MNVSDMIVGLSRCKFTPGSWDKRFVRDMNMELTEHRAIAGYREPFEITSKQREQLVRLVHFYRGQLEVARGVAAMNGREGRGEGERRRGAGGGV